MATTTNTEPPPAPAGRRSRRRLAATLWTAAFLGSAVPWAVAAVREDTAADRRTPVEPIRPYVQAPTAEGAVLSPDGRRVAFTVDTDDDDYLYVVGADGSGLRRLADDVTGDLVAFTPDGRRVLYLGAGAGYGEVAVRSVGADGRNPKRLGRVDQGDGLRGGLAFSRDGRRLVYAYDTTIPCSDGGCGHPQEQDLYVMAVDGSGARQLTGLPGVERSPAISPDGRLVAFTALVGDFRDVFVVDVAGGPPRRLTQQYHDAHDLAFTPDGAAVAFAESRWDDRLGRNVDEAHAVGLDGSPRAVATAAEARSVYVEGPPNGTKDVYVRDPGAAHARRVTDLAAEPALDPAAGDL